MTATLIIKCDGPNCKRAINSEIHAGTWLTLEDRDIFKKYINTNPNKHFCSYYCLINCIIQSKFFVNPIEQINVQTMLDLVSYLPKEYVRILAQVLYGSGYNLSDQCFNGLCESCIIPEKCCCTHHLSAQSVKLILS